MNKKGQWWIWTQVALWIIVILVIVWGGTSLYKVNKLSKVIEEQGQQIANTLEKTNSLLGKYEQMPPKIEEIKSRIISLDDKSNKIKLDVDKLHEIQASLNKNAEFLDNISKNLIQLQKEYPPVQTQNIVFTNATNEDVTNILTDIIKNRSTSLTISFVFGALFGSLIGVALFKFGPVIYQKIKNKPKQGSEK
ncbi:hypothetical protein J4436_04720 [Candidatus Woesearchaeota archaeon]|nr:hypothetical protein [Candidatus Woesearchaeota archaeon]